MRFANPRVAPPAILRFARRWGVLSLCRKHGLPTTHVHAGESGFCRQIGHEEQLGGGGREPIAAWRKYAREASALVDAAASVLGGAPMDARTLAILTEAPGPDPETWSEVAPEPRDSDLREMEPWQGRGDLHRDLVEFYIDRWLRYANVRLGFAWARRGPEIVLGGSDGLFRTLAMELAFRVTRTERMVMCSGCRRPVPARPRPGERTYCPDCRRDHAPQRHAARDYRARKRLSRDR